MHLTGDHRRNYRSCARDGACRCLWVDKDEFSSLPLCLFLCPRHITQVHEDWRGKLLLSSESNLQAFSSFSAGQLSRLSLSHSSKSTKDHPWKHFTQDFLMWSREIPLKRQISCWFSLKVYCIHKFPLYFHLSWQYWRYFVFQAWEEEPWGSFFSLPTCWMKGHLSIASMEEEHFLSLKSTFLRQLIHHEEISRERES